MHYDLELNKKYKQEAVVTKAEGRLKNAMHSKFRV
jgi:hypothetical protein